MKRVLPIICVFSLIIACSIAPTKPNISAIYRIPALKSQLEPISSKAQTLTQEPLSVRAQALFQRLYALDHVSALESGKLPEFQGKVGGRQILALTRFIELIANATTEEKANLAMLLKVGKPNISRYCAPLQAIYWLLEEDECLLRNPLQYYIIDILNYAWDYTDHNRWGDYEVVTDRLNSPELINLYEQMNFRYVEGYGDRLGYSKLIFKSNGGDCRDYTAFSVYCLHKAGYGARAIKVVSPSGRHAYHVVCEYEDKDGKKYIMDNSCVSCGSGEGITEKEIYTKELPQIGFGYM